MGRGLRLLCRARLTSLCVGQVRSLPVRDVLAVKQSKTKKYRQVRLTVSDNTNIDESVCCFTVH